MKKGIKEGTIYTKVHMSELKNEYPFNDTKAQSSPRKWGIHVEIWENGWIDDEDFLFFTNEQERDKIYTQMEGEEYVDSDE